MGQSRNLTVGGSTVNNVTCSKGVVNTVVVTQGGHASTVWQRTRHGVIKAMNRSHSGPFNVVLTSIDLAATLKVAPFGYSKEAGVVPFMPNSDGSVKILVGRLAALATFLRFYDDYGHEVNFSEVDIKITTKHHIVTMAGANTLVANTWTTKIGKFYFHVPLPTSAGTTVIKYHMSVRKHNDHSLVWELPCTFHIRRSLVKGSLDLFATYPASFMSPPASASGHTITITDSIDQLIRFSTFDATAAQIKSYRDNTQVKIKSVVITNSTGAVETHIKVDPTTLPIHYTKVSALKPFDFNFFRHFILHGNVKVVITVDVLPPDGVLVANHTHTYTILPYHH